MEITKSFNSREIGITISLYNASLNIVDAPIEDINNGMIILNDTNLKYLAIENSILNPIPTGTIEYEDDNTLNSILKLGALRPIDTIINIKINDNAASYAYDMMFIMTDISIIGIEMDRTIYQLKFEGYNSIYLNKKIPYATTYNVNADYEEELSPYEIARLLLLKSGYKEYGTGTLPYTSVKTSFITGQNTTVKESVNSLLAHGIGMNGNNSPVYLVNSLKDSKWQMLTMKDMFSGTNPCGTNATHIFPLTYTMMSNTILDNSGLFDTKMNVIRSISSDSFTNNANKYKLLNNYQFEEFNHEDRTWTSYKNIRNIIRTLVSKAGTTNDSIFNASVGDTMNETYYSYPSNECTMLYDAMTTLECCCSQINVDVNGTMKYDAGQIINIGEEGPSNTDYQHLYGKWVATTVKHSFRNATYTTNMILCRQNYVDSIEKS